MPNYEGLVCTEIAAWGEQRTAPMTTQRVYATLRPAVAGGLHVHHDSPQAGPGPQRPPGCPTFFVRTQGHTPCPRPGSPSSRATEKLGLSLVVAKSGHFDVVCLSSLQIREKWCESRGRGRLVSTCICRQLGLQNPQPGDLWDWASSHVSHSPSLTDRGLADITLGCRKLLALLTRMQQATRGTHGLRGSPHTPDFEVSRREGLRGDHRMLTLSPPALMCLVIHHNLWER